ncbi:MAG: DUF4175 family protein [Rhodothalassiaceae bacterium]
MNDPRPILRRRLALARGFASLERLWPRLFGLALLIAGFLAAAGLGLFPLLPIWLHRLLLAVLLGALLWQVVALARGFQPADREAAARWFERRGGAAHRPLEALDDTPAGDDPLAQALWDRHRARMAEAAAKTRLAAPRLSWLEQDPRALRAGVLMVLLLGLLVAGPDLGRRLDDSLSLTPGSVPRDVALDLWITPPDYTDRPPMVLDARGGRVDLPEGSRITARLNGGRAQPVLHLGDQRFAFTREGEEVHSLNRPVPTGGDMKIVQGGTTRGSWRLHYIPDTAPQARWTEAPGLTPRHAFALPFEIDDDYGITGGRMIMTAGAGNAVRYGPGTPDQAGLRAALIVPLAEQRLGQGPVQSRLTRDLAEHYWAGEAVEIRLEVEDARGQIGRSTALKLVLPERPFDQPAAQALVALRKQLIRQPGDRADVLRELDALSREPGLYGGDIVAFAVLRSAYWRLRGDRSEMALDEAIGLLWQAALRIEDGQLSIAERNLRQTLSDLQEALSGEEDLSSLTDQLMQQLDQLMAAHQAQQGDSPSQPLPSSEQGQTQLIDRRMLEAMARQVQALAEAGRTEEARQMLQQLQQILENLQPNPLSPEDAQRMMAAARAADMLEDLKQEQRELLNQTARQTVLNRLMQQQGQQSQTFQPLSEQQQAISQALEDLQKSMQESGLTQPGAEQARQAAEAARQALQGQAGGDAVSRQAEALKALDEASNAMQQQLSRSMQQQQRGGARDPFGNALPNINTMPFDLPDADDQRRVEEILRDLRRRLSDPNLSAEERRYLERLLRRF